MTRKKEQDKQPVNISNNPNNPLTEYYQGLANYRITNNNMLVHVNGDQVTPLVYGAIAITSEITRVNGVDNEIVFEIIASNVRGDLLHRIRVNASDFNSLNWIIKNYGCNIAITSGQTVKQKLLTGITLTGLNCIREKVYTHLGYIYQDNKPVNFLHAGGDLLGDQSIKTDIDKTLSGYKMLPPGNEHENIQAVTSVLTLIESQEYTVTYPLLAFSLLGSISPIIRTVCGNQKIGLYAYGKTQSGKTTTACLFLSLYGIFNELQPPVSFNATINAIRELSFISKDVSLLIDDNKPVKDKNEKRKTDNFLQELSRGMGDNSTRVKLNSDSTLKAIHPPRCYTMITGEDLPDIGQSGLSRFYLIPFNRCRKDITKQREYAKKGILSRGNACYIKFIIEHYEMILITFENIYNEKHKELEKQFGECRLTNQATLLMSSLYCFLYFCSHTGILTSNQANELFTTGCYFILKTAQGIEQQIKDNDPVNQYLAALSDVLATGQKYLINLNDNKFDTWSLSDDIIGYCDQEYIYLSSTLAYKTVCEQLQAQNSFFSIGKTTIQKQLFEKGYLISDQANNVTIVKNIHGYSVRLLKFNRKQLLEFNNSSDNSGGDT